MLAKFKSWLDQPFNGSMSAARWLAFIGLILACLFIWRMVLSNLESI